MALKKLVRKTKTSEELGVLSFKKRKCLYASYTNGETPTEASKKVGISAPLANYYFGRFKKGHVPQEEIAIGRDFSLDEQQLERLISLNEKEWSLNNIALAIGSNKSTVARTLKGLGLESQCLIYNTLKPQQIRSLYSSWLADENSSQAARKIDKPRQTAHAYYGRFKTGDIPIVDSKTQEEIQID